METSSLAYIVFKLSIKLLVNVILIPDFRGYCRGPVQNALTIYFR